MSKEKLTTEYLINGWLEKYHGITVEQLCEKEPELIKSIAWFDKYAVTTEQHEDWYNWAVDELSKNLCRSKKYIKKYFCFDYLNIAPSINNKKRLI